MEKPYLIPFKQILISDSKIITVAQEVESIPFHVKRIYWISVSDNETDISAHANKAQSQVMVSLNGSMEVRLEGLGEYKQTFVLKNPGVGLYIPPMYWKEFEYAKHSSVLCFASDFYRAEDYIRDYYMFKQNNTSSVI
jgi:hypothetical protein